MNFQEILEKKNGRQTIRTSKTPPPLALRCSVHDLEFGKEGVLVFLPQKGKDKGFCCNFVEREAIQRTGESAGEIVR